MNPPHGTFKERSARLPAVLSVLHLTFSEGYSAAAEQHDLLMRAARLRADSKDLAQRRSIEDSEASLSD
jgi:predicted RNA polymerase sigma factor